MINFSDFYQLIANNKLLHWLETLPIQISKWQQNCLYKQFINQWNNSVAFLPKIIPYDLDLLNGVIAKSRKPLIKSQIFHIKKLMCSLTPWRKGPFSLYGLNIDSEWRSDWKWKRILPHLSNLKGRTVLDVGCGNGYYLWRIIGAGAHLAIGIDPMPLFLCQFEAVRKLLGDQKRVYLLPLSIEQIPKLAVFDTVFSMGVLCHRKSPLDHLFQLKNQLINNGELVLETLIIKGNKNTVLVPSDRYAKMRNVYFIPSALALRNWLLKCGFIKIRIANICTTTTKEQRQTEWMTMESLENFLDSKNVKKTIEGYPSPIRAVLIARKP